jgi:molybdopterin-guanine dinucleotide biosynthesis protein A
MDIDAVILAGGLSSRMGKDKSLVKLNKKNLISHVMASIKPQVNKVWINTNKALDEFPHDIQFADLVQPSIGPLGGIFSALNKIESEWIQFCPNDCPFLPENLVKKMYAKKNSEHIKALLPLVNDKYEPTFLLCHRSVLRTITSFIEAKNYKLMDWVKANNFQAIEFSDPKAFINMNDPSTLKKYQDE